MTEAVAVSGIVGGVEPGYDMQPNAKLKKCNFISSNKTRIDMKFQNPIEWIDSANQLGISGDVGSYALENDFGNIFRSIFVVCDIQVLTAAGFRYWAVRNYNIS